MKKNNRIIKIVGFGVLFFVLVIVIGRLYLEFKISNLDKNFKSVSASNEARESIISDIKNIKFLQNIPFVRSKAIWAYDMYASSLENAIWKESKDAINAHIRFVHANLDPSIYQITEYNIRQRKIDSIENIELEKNPLGRVQNSFCEKWQESILFLREIGYTSLLEGNYCN